MFYLAVPLVVFLYRWGTPAKVLSIIFALSAAFYFSMGYLYQQEHDPIFSILQRQLPAQMMFFGGGALLYYYLGLFKRYSLPLLLAAALTYMLYSFTQADYLFPLYALSLSVIVIYLAVIFPYLGHIARYGDLSYGIYIWHFPTIQTFISLKLFDKDPLLALLGLTIVVIILAWLSWHIVEKPFLGKKSHYIEESRESS